MNKNNKGNKTQGLEHRKQIFKERLQLENFNKMANSRAQLPVYHYKTKILETIANNNVVVIAGYEYPEIPLTHLFF